METNENLKDLPATPAKEKTRDGLVLSWAMAAIMGCSILIVGFLLAMLCFLVYYP